MHNTQVHDVPFSQMYIFIHWNDNGIVFKNLHFETGSQFAFSGPQNTLVM